MSGRLNLSMRRPGWLPSPPKRQLSLFRGANEKARFGLSFLSVVNVVEQARNYIRERMKQALDAET